MLQPLAKQPVTGTQLGKLSGVLWSFLNNGVQTSIFNLISVNSSHPVGVCGTEPGHLSNSSSQKTFKWQWQFYCGGPEKDKGIGWLASEHGSLGEGRCLPWMRNLTCKVQQFYRLRVWDTNSHISHTFIHTRWSNFRHSADKSVFPHRLCRCKKYKKWKIS